MDTTQERNDHSEPKGKHRRSFAEIKADSRIHAGGNKVWDHEKGLHKHGKPLRNNTR